MEVPAQSLIPAPRGIDIATDRLEAAHQAFDSFVKKEIEAARLFGKIATKLYVTRLDEFRTDIEIAGQRGGLAAAAFSGYMPARFSDPDTPMYQSIYYPGIPLADETVGVLSETIGYFGGLDTPISSRHSQLYVVTPKTHQDFLTEDEPDYLFDDAIEHYSRAEQDMTGDGETETAFTRTHELFFGRHYLPEDQKTYVRKQERAFEEQNNYVARLEQIGTIVLGNEQ